MIGIRVNFAYAVVIQRFPYLHFMGAQHMCYNGAQTNAFGMEGERKSGLYVVVVCQKHTSRWKPRFKRSKVADRSPGVIIWIHLLFPLLQK
jgi:hypothetical protein